MLNKFKYSLLASTILLTACGGSSNDDNNNQISVEPPNTLPTASFSSVTADEKSEVNVVADVDGNGDSIVKYEWSSSSHPNLVLSSADTNTITFTAPEVSKNTTIDLSLTVTASDGDTTTVTGEALIEQLTIPLTITGLATDAPIADAEIAVKIAGRETTVNAVADSSGAYTVDLILDDSEAAAFISIEARGVGEQSSAGLISLLGTAGLLAEQAGDDGELTADESFSVNVTNLSTAQYAFTKLANDGEEITSDEQLVDLSESIDYEEVMVLATAIKVAIDKAGDNTDLALPSDISDTLTLVEAIIGSLIAPDDSNTDSAIDYVQSVSAEPEFQEAQEEILTDENLIDTSGYVMPSSYYLLPSNTLSSGAIFYFNEDGTGKSIGAENTWQASDGFISVINTNYETTESVEYIDLPNDEYDYEVEVEVETYTSAYQLRRISSNEKGDIVTLTTTTVKRYPNDEMSDEVTNSNSTHLAVRDSEIKSINFEGIKKAYLSIGFQQEVGEMLVSADEFTFNDDGTGNALLQNSDFNWQVTDGVLTLDLGEDGTVTYKLLSEQDGIEHFAFEDILIDDEEITQVDGISVGEGKISAQYPQWTAESVAGIYVYENLSFEDPNEQFWFELHENGNAETYSTVDYNQDGMLTTDEAFTMYGSWEVNEQGELLIYRVRLAEEYEDGTSFGPYSEECRTAETEGCVLFHTRTWRLISNTDVQYSLYHKHHFRYSYATTWQTDDYISYDIRSVYKRDAAPIDIDSLEDYTAPLSSLVRSKASAKPISKVLKNGASKASDTNTFKTSEKYRRLEPSLN
jgi:hypothetical protein